MLPFFSYLNVEDFIKMTISGFGSSSENQAVFAVSGVNVNLGNISQGILVRRIQFL